MIFAKQPALIWDTNGIDCIIRGLVDKITYKAAPGSAPTQNAQFLESFGFILDAFVLQRCTNFSSDRIALEEANPRLPACHFRNSHRLVEVFCGIDGFTHQFVELIEEKIQFEETTDEEVRSIQALVEEDIGPNDASLIVAALKTGNRTRRPAIIITDDGAVYRQVNLIKARYQYIEVGPARYLTKYLSTFFSIQVLRELHVSCGIDNETWSHILIGFKRHQDGREEYAAREHDKRVVKFLKTFSSDRDAKAQRALERELYQQFGGEDA